MRKDYYEILRIFPSSSMEEVRKAYRKLAFRYHPDTSAGNIDTADHFREITEAYEVLSDVSKRFDYDCTHGFRSKSHQVNISPELILQEASRLRRYVYSLNLFSLDHEALEYQIGRLLSERNVEMLQDFGHKQLNRHIIMELIDATRFMKYEVLGKTVVRLHALAQGDAALEKIIIAYENQRRKKYMYDRYLPFVVFILTLLLCFLVYLAGI